MCCSFVGTLLSPPPLPALERRVDYMSMKKINIFLFTQLLGFIYSAFVCWGILIIVAQWPNWWHYFASHRMTALPRAQTKRASAQKGPPLCTGRDVFMPLLGCVLWDCLSLSHSSDFLDLLRCRRICCCQSCLLYSATATLGLKAEKCQKNFSRYWAKFIPDVMMLWDYAGDNFQAFAF